MTRPFRFNIGNQAIQRGPIFDHDTVVLCFGWSRRRAPLLSAGAISNVKQRKKIEVNDAFS